MNAAVMWSEPVTYGASKFEVMTVELHARPVAVVNTLEDARLIGAAPELLAALKAVQMDAVGVGAGENVISDASRALVDNAIAKAKGA